MAAATWRTVLMYLSPELDDATSFCSVSKFRVVAVRAPTNEESREGSSSRTSEPSAVVCSVVTSNEMQLLAGPARLQSCLDHVNNGSQCTVRLLLLSLTIDSSRLPLGVDRGIR